MVLLSPVQNCLWILRLKPERCARPNFQVSCISSAIIFGWTPALAWDRMVSWDLAATSPARFVVRSKRPVSVFFPVLLRQRCPGFCPLKLVY